MYKRVPSGDVKFRNEILQTGGILLDEGNLLGLQPTEKDKDFIMDVMYITQSRI